MTEEATPETSDRYGGDFASFNPALSLCTIVHHGMDRRTWVISHWSPASIPDQAGRVAVVTGANSGIGFAAAHTLAHKNAIVVLACRSIERGKAAAATLKREEPSAVVCVLRLDLGCLDSIQSFHEEFLRSFHRLDILVNNAGVLLGPYGRTADGFEKHIGVNHLGHFALTGLLMDRMLDTAGSRVVTVSSLAHARAKGDAADLLGDPGKRYSALRAYARSKLANLLFAYELDRRLTGTKTLSIAAHPGGAVTDLGRRMGEHLAYRAVRPFLEWFSQGAARASHSILRAATDPAVTGGEYYGPGGWMGLRGHPVLVSSSSHSRDERLSHRLWEASEQLTGVAFP